MNRKTTTNRGTQMEHTKVLHRVVDNITKAENENEVARSTQINYQELDERKI